MNCTKCGLEGRAGYVDEREGGAYVKFVCPNPGCASYKSVFAEEWVCAD